MPARRQSLIEAATSALGGSSMPTQPTNVRSVWMINICNIQIILLILTYSCNNESEKRFRRIQRPNQSVPALTSYSIKRVESSKARSSFLMWLSRVARARQRRVSLPVPYSLITDMSFSLMPGVKGTLLLPTRMCVHLSITPSGAPYEQKQTRESGCKEKDGIISKLNIF